MAPGAGTTVAADADPQRVRHMVYLAAGLPFEGKSADPAIGRYTDLTTGGMSPDELAQLERLLTVYLKTVVGPTIAQHGREPAARAAGLGQRVRGRRPEDRRSVQLRRYA
ncbi:MAG: hypothetical protein ACRDOI_45825 [Trebonia sp.]